MIKIPIKTRVLIVLQICVGLSMLIWLIGYPFMGEYFKLQSEKLVIESVMGEQNTLFRLDFDRAHENLCHALKNKERFDKLDEPQKASLNNLWRLKQEEISASFTQKLMRAFALLLKIPKTLLIWTLLAVFIPIWILLNPLKAKSYVYFLPLITLAYCINNQVNGLDPREVSDIGLFPNENELIPQISFPTKEEVKLAWNNYLIENFGGDHKRADLSKEDLISEAEFNFNLARIKLFPSLSATFWQKQSILMLLLYLAWNLNFAWQTSKLNQNKTL